jgi:hypothetical protein
MSAYSKQLDVYVAKCQAEEVARREEKARRESQTARERLTPLEDRLSRLLATVPEEVQREGLSLSSLQTSLRGRWRGNAHPGEIGLTLRKLGYVRKRQWRGKDEFKALWYPRF